MARNIEYNPSIIQTFANRLYSQANFIVFLFTILGFLSGAFFGFVLDGGGVGANDLHKITDDGTMLIYITICSVIIGLLGFAIGLSIAFRFKLQAQVALCQKTIEENTHRKA